MLFSTTIFIYIYTCLESRISHPEFLIYNSTICVCGSTTVFFRVFFFPTQHLCFQGSLQNVSVACAYVHVFWPQYVIRAMIKTASAALCRIISLKTRHCVAHSLFLSPRRTQLFGDVCYHCNRVIEGDGERTCSDCKYIMVHGWSGHMSLIVHCALLTAVFIRALFTL